MKNSFSGTDLRAAGAAGLDARDRDAVEDLNGWGDGRRDGLEAVASRSPVGVSVTSCGSLLNLHAAAGRPGRGLRALPLPPAALSRF